MSVPRGDARQIARGRRAGGRKAAMRLHQDWETELATDEMGKPHLSATKRQELEEALTLLAQRHAGIKRDARESTRPPELSGAAKTKLYASRGRALANEQLTRATRATRAHSARAGARAYRQSGVPQAAASWSTTIMQTLGSMLGLALLYLVLTSAEQRPGAINTAVLGVADAFRHLISPATDILPGARATSSGQPQLGGIPFTDVYHAGIVAGPLVPRRLRPATARSTTR